MKYFVKLTLGFLFCMLTLMACRKQDNRPYIIQKKNGKIILAYKAFSDFLDSDKSWESYKTLLLDAYPEVWEVHRRQLEWGVIDTTTFPDLISRYKKEDYQKYFSQYDMETLNYLYDSVIEKAHDILPPLEPKTIDLCFFLPYGSCFVVPEQGNNTIYISMLINPDEVEKIMAHEYGHVMHFERKPEEPLSLKGEIISEGMAVYLTNRIVKDLKVENSIPFMPENSFAWCMENEETIKDSIKLELNDTTTRLFVRYISDGSFAKPPEGFVQKTGYFIGYRIIETCIDKGLTLEEICSLDAQSVIDSSHYFN